MRCITSANVACGFHGATRATMHETVLLAVEATASPSRLHPGFHLIAYQFRLVAAMLVIARRTDYRAHRPAPRSKRWQRSLHAKSGMRQTHVKAHGAALQHGGPRDRSVADAIARAVASVDAVAHAARAFRRRNLVAAGTAAGPPTAREAFAGSRTVRGRNAGPAQRSRAPSSTIRRGGAGRASCRLRSDPDVDTICARRHPRRRRILRVRIRAALQNSPGFDVRNFSVGRVPD